MRNLILLTLLLFVGCVTSPQVVMDSWLGKTEHQLMLEWGPPAQTDSDGRGGKILTYGGTRNYGQTAGVMRRDFAGNVYYTAPQQNTSSWVRQFYVDSEGNIYSHRWQGN